MKNRDLIRLLQMLEPDDEVTFDVGLKAEDRDYVGRAALLDSNMLYCLTIHAVEVIPTTNGLRAVVILWQDDDQLRSNAEHFYDIYVKK